MEMFGRIRLKQTRAVGLALLFCGLLAPNLGVCASIKLERKSDSGSQIAISGEIVRGDVGVFKGLVSQLPGLGQPDYSAHVRLQSNGGDVQAAMEIGRVIRTHGMTTWVDRMEGGRCVSACVFILAGGVLRSSPGAALLADSGIGIHRPFDTDLKTRPADISDQRFKTMDSEVRAYLREMNMADQLADAILSIPPYDVKFLTEREATDYRLIGTDPAYGDMIATRHAKELGISKQQYYSRLKPAAAKCPIPPSESLINDKAALDRYLDCYNGVMKYGR